MQNFAGNFSLSRDDRVKEMGTEDSDSSGGVGGGGGRGRRARSLALKALVLFGGALILKRLWKSTTRWDHARVVAESLCGEKVRGVKEVIFLEFWSRVLMGLA